MIHLTNDAVQKKGEEFGKHEDSNKVKTNLFSLVLITSSNISEKQGLVHINLMKPTNK